MNSHKSKKQILEEAEYTYSPKHEVYFNKKCKQIFSLEAIGTYDSTWLIEKLNKETENNWCFCFKKEPSEHVKTQIVEQL